ncbi:Nuclear condensing complex subunits, C-term domain containing protein, putative [Leishmania donovani]|uniref:Nuclear condensing complex subunits, C-term domain containing protein, putative n=1 Tax=Leishmania donovani TaxID=5661 RepID=A0A3Q8IFD1_LEIDO|nr:Nuclear condensing complex subunits, C-term domain containing protein, putative [Leishmania donovani]
MGSHKKAAAVSSTDTFEEVGRIFQQVHQSAAHAQKCKKKLISLGQESAPQLCRNVCDVVLLILKQVTQIAPEAMRRHYAFVTELCKAFRESFESDQLAIELLKSVSAFHNAMDKAVRLAVVSTFEALLKTVDQSNVSEERQDFYQEAAELLKQRVHDKCPQVRAKAVASVAAFQSGKKDCDVTQQLIALLCCDTNADVRKQILHSIAPRKEFLEGYFHGIIRCIRDVVARVRAEAWDVLGRFPWRYITAYADAKGVKMPELLAAGLDDSNASVVIACRAAITNSWVHRDCKDVCEDFMNSIACGYVLPSLSPYERISAELLVHARKRQANTHFPLKLDDINTAGLLLWKADCRVSCDTEGEDETQLLPPLGQFSAVLQDTVYAYARPDAEPKTVKFRSVEDADNMLRILLSVFDIYDDNAYLAHADNTTRASLLRLINFILKVVPDEDPSLFVDVAVRALKSLTARTPEEATKTITSALDSLFRSLKLPQRHSLGFDDVEAIGRKSRERQQELVKRKVLLRTGELAEESYTELKEEMDRDEKFLLRMQLIVLAFLSHSQRGDAIPMFCYHIIQMGRHLDNEKVRVAATKSLCLQCLINPESVHTFMPLILADSQENAGGAVGADMSLPIAAIGVIFDLIMEYGLRFFDVAKRPPNEARALYNSESEIEARLQREQELAEEDVHKVGSKRLLSTLQFYLQPGNEAKHIVTSAGFCKLLSCNRLPAEVVPHVVAVLLIHYTGAMASKKESITAAYMMDFLGTFFRSYAASHPKRQVQVCEGGITAFRVVLERNIAMASRLIEFVARLTDAYTLTVIRDIDPQAAMRATRDVVDETGGAAEEEVEAQRKSNRTNATRSSMQSGRLFRELSRHSLHERLSQELLVVLASSELVESRAACMDALEKCMYFYSLEPQPFLLHCAAAALEATRHAAPIVYDRLEAWQTKLRERCAAAGAAPQSNGPMSDAESADSLEQRWCEALKAHEEKRDALLEAGFGGFASIPPQLDVASPVMVKVEMAESKRERHSDVFGVESIVGPRKRSRH